MGDAIFVGWEPLENLYDIPTFRFRLGCIRRQD